jgi:hypothetical protein
MVSATNWARKFDDPVTLPDGRKLTRLKEAMAWLAKEIPKSEHGMKEVQAAAHCVTEAAENNGLMDFARMGMMQAIHRHERRVFSDRKETHWGKRKLKRDQ